MSQRERSKLHIVMFPWFAMGHNIPYLHLSNELAQRGHTISFILPNKPKLHLQTLNLHPSLITFYTIAVPAVQGLPSAAETTSDVPFHLHGMLATAMDKTRPEVEQIIAQLNPHFVFYDLAHWIPDITSKLGIKSIYCSVITAVGLAVSMIRATAKYYCRDIEQLTAEDLTALCPEYPSTVVVLRKHEAQNALNVLASSQEFGVGIRFYDRIITAMESADAIAIRTCREIEGHFCDYLSAQYDKTVLPTSPILPKDPETPLDERWASWLGRFPESSVVYCSFGSQFVFEKKQLQEILLGLEMTDLPFFVAVKPPTGCLTLGEAMPEGFEKRVKGRGIVHGGWVEQPLILSHPSVGCFVNHCGTGTMWEALMKSRAQMVLVPQLGDQILSTRLMAGELKVAVEVEKMETGWVSKESLCKAVREAMNEESEIGRVIRENHAKWRGVLTSPGFITGYIDSLVHNLQMLLECVPRKTSADS